ncbi:hypothetical protein ACWGQ5_45385, partial [Streptomyces sp. NPDC055722]
LSSRSLVTWAAYCDVSPVVAVVLSDMMLTFLVSNWVCQICGAGAERPCACVPGSLIEQRRSLQ